MTIERLETMTQEYLQKMKSRVAGQYPDEIRIMLYQEHEQMIKEFIGMIPNSNYLEQYRKYFEFDPMTDMTQRSMENTIQKICERINMTKRGLEENKKIEELEMQQTQQEPENYARRNEIHQTLVEMFAIVVEKMKIAEFNINWDALERNCKEIIENHIDKIAKDGFTKKEKDTFEQEVKNYIVQVKGELAMDPQIEAGVAKPNVEWKEGNVCPVVVNTDEFARANREIVEELEQSEQDNERENEYGGLPGNAIE